MFDRTRIAYVEKWLMALSSMQPVNERHKPFYAWNVVKREIATTVLLCTRVALHCQIDRCEVTVCVCRPPTTTACAIVDTRRTWVALRLRTPTTNVLRVVRQNHVVITKFAFLRVIRQRHRKFAIRTRRIAGPFSLGLYVSDSRRSRDFFARLGLGLGL